MCRLKSLEDLLNLTMYSVRDQPAPEDAEEMEEILLDLLVIPIEDERTEIQRQRDEFVIRFNNRCEGMLQYCEKYFEKRPEPMEREQKVDWSAVQDCIEQIRRDAASWIELDQEDIVTLEEHSETFCTLLKKLIQLVWDFMAGIKAHLTLFQCAYVTVRWANESGVQLMKTAVETYGSDVEMRGQAVKRVAELWNVLDELKRIPRNNVQAMENYLLWDTKYMYVTMLEIKKMMGVGEAYKCVSTLLDMMIDLIPSFKRLLEDDRNGNRMYAFEKLLEDVGFMELQFRKTSSLLDPHQDLDHDPGIKEALRDAYYAVRHIENGLVRIEGLRDITPTVLKSAAGLEGNKESA